MLSSWCYKLKLSKIKGGEARQGRLVLYSFLCFSLWRGKHIQLVGLLSYATMLRDFISVFLANASIESVQINA